MSYSNADDRAASSRAGLRLSACCLMALCWLAACTKTSPEQALRQTLAELQQSVEARDTDALQAHLAEDFVGPQGMDKTGARRLAALMLMRHDAVGVVFGPLDLRMQDSHATVRFTAAVTGGSGRMLPDAAQVYEVETGWRWQDDAWRMTSAVWEPKL